MDVVWFMLVVLLSVVGDWRTVTFQRPGFYYKPEHTALAKRSVV